MDKARRIRSEKVREHQYREQYTRSSDVGGINIQWVGYLKMGIYPLPQVNTQNEGIYILSRLK